MLRGRGLRVMNSSNQIGIAQSAFAAPLARTKRLMPELKHVRCRSEQVLLNADSSLDYVFFPR